MNYSLPSPPYTAPPGITELVPEETPDDANA
jgi:hypothetical protein